MALEVGTLNARIKVDTAGVSSSLNAVKRDLNDVKKSADKVEKNNIDVTPKGGDKVNSVSQSARKLGDNLREAGTAGKGVSVNPQVASELDKASNAGGKLRGILSGLSNVAGVVGLGAAVGGVSAAFTDMVKAGNAYRSELNTMNAVSNATESQMRAVSEAAKQLGNDTELANTSASDAAAAMTELAKGGFTVEQSISAAKGTLQLAAAAQVDAATAATIQSQALQAFSLDAQDAARVSDILAGAANASSAEMTGISAGLQQAGTVANQFGISIDDTATALAMFANAGIQGSDAGTLLKTALLALTDQGNPAQGAIEELGLTVYDASGKFVGLSSLMGQLKDAAGRMSDEQYQAATATLFGSDAMRLAGIAAEQGSEGFDSLKGAVTRQGQAAEVAAAQTEGLPGAIGRVENAWETAQTEIFEATEGGMVAALNVATAGIEGLTGLITGPGFKIAGQIFENLGGQVQVLAQGAKAAGDVFAGVFVPGADDMSSALEKISGKVDGLNDGLSGWQIPIASAALVAFGANALGVTGKLNEGSGAVRRFGQEMQVQKALAQGFGKEISTAGAAIDVLRSRSTLLDSTLTNASTAYMSSSAKLRTMAASHKTAAAAAQAQALTTKSAFTSIDLVGQQMGHSFAATTLSMGAKAKGLSAGGLAVMKGAMGGVKTAANGLIGALGGPWGLAIMGASAVIGHFVQKHQEAKQAEEQHKAAQDELRNSLDQTTGAITNQTNELINKKIQESGAADAARELGIAQGTVRDAVTGNIDAMNQVKSATEGAVGSALNGSKQWESLSGTFERSGVSIEDVTQALLGNKDAMDKINSSDAMLQPGVAQAWEGLKNEMEDTTGAAMTLGKEVGTLNGDLESVKADAAKDALANLESQSEKTSKVLSAVGDSITSIPDDKTIHVESMAPKVRQEMRDLGLEVKDLPDGQVEVKFPDGHNITQMLMSMGAQIKALPDGSISVDDNTPEVKQRLIDLGVAAKDPKTGEVKIKDNISEVIGKQIQLGAAVKTETGEVYIKNNTGQVIAELTGLGIKVSQLPPGSVRIADNTPEVRGKLANLGVQTVTLPDGHIAITDTSPQNLQNLANVGVTTQTLPPGFIQIDDTSPENMARLSDLGVKTTTLPNGKVVITDNAEATRNHITSTLSRENTNTFSDHVISITRRIRDVFERANGGIDMPVETYAGGGHRDRNVDRAVQRRAKSNHEPAHQAQIAPAGSYRVFAESETGGEAYIPMAESKRARSEKILNEVASRFGYQLVDGETGTVQTFADGALLPASVVKHRLSYMDGTPYIFGGWSRAGVDCSGAVALAVNAADGIDEWKERTATGDEANFLRRHNYKPGRGGNGDIRVAFYNGGPGGGHTAMQLDDGTFIESGGNTGGGFTIGKTAGPLENRGFTDWWYKRGGVGLTTEGLDPLNSLNGVVGGPASGVSGAARSMVESTYSPDGGEAESRELNGGAGTLIKDGSFLELMAALYSKQTGTPMADDIVSWGQVIGLYSKANQQDADKELEKAQKELDKSNDSLESTKQKLAKAREDLPLAEEDLRIKKMKRDEVYNKTDKNGNKTATDSQKAAADQSVAKAERKVRDTKAKIAQLEKEQKELEAKIDTLDADSLYGDLAMTTKGIGGTSGNKYADAIIQEGRRRGITDRGIKIALATAIVESGLKMYANNADPESLNFPHDAIGSDHDSVGLFQQRNNGAWGTTADRMDPAKSAGMFYDRLDDQDYNQGDPGAHAQRVQGSAFPGRYATKMNEAQGYLDKYNSTKNAKITAMADGGILGGLRQAQINEGDSAVLWGEAGPEAYIPLSSDKRARSLDIWAETGKRLGIDVMSMLNLIGSGLPGLMEGQLDFSTGGSISAERLGVNMDAASYRGKRGAQDTVHQAQNAVGAVFNGPVQINDPRKYLQGQVDNASKQLGMAMRSVLL